MGLKAAKGEAGLYVSCEIIAPLYLGIQPCS